MEQAMSVSRQSVDRAMDHHRQGRIAEAEIAYRDVLLHDPKNPDALHLLGTITAGNGKALEGIALIERALAIHASPEAHFNLANIYAGLYRFPEAELHYRESMRLRPGQAEAANGIGGAALRLGRYDEAEEWLKTALELDSRCISALINMGILMDARGRFTETIGYYDRALALDPQQAEAHQFKAIALLARGRLDEGWNEFVWRFKYSPAFYGRFPHPYWRGETLAGRKILVWTEQGLGDEILLASMIPDLLRRGAHVVLLASARLSDLFKRSFPTVDVIPVGGRPTDATVMEDIAFQASMSDLGSQLRPSLDAFPNAHGYLAPNAALTTSVRRKYKSGRESTLLVGISWRSRARDGGQEKTIPLELWAPVLRVPGMTFVNLQYGDTKAEVAAVERTLGVTILNDDDIDQSGDMTPVASQVACLDYVVTISNTTAHVAGAVGKPTSVLIPSNSGRLWYWFLERADSPWYPSLRLFRQRDARWETTMKEVATTLTEQRASRT
jgi:tetratricopeptide (TPR) repeat protein